MISKPTLEAALQSIAIAKNFIGLQQHREQLVLDAAFEELLKYKNEHYPEKEQDDAAVPSADD